MDLRENENSIDVSFKPKARLILQLGDRLIANEKIAISEIIKNSYDACAKNVIVYMNDIDDISKGEIIIIDDGKGMNLDILQNVWMEPGTDFKEKILYKGSVSECKNRLPIGEKGIGRFGVHKLGNKIELISKKINDNEVKLFIDWNRFNSDKYLNEEKIQIIEKTTKEKNYFHLGESGTYIKLTSLRKSWILKDFKIFHRNITSLVSPFKSKDDFNIEIKTNLDWEDGLMSLKSVKEKALWYFKVTTKDNNIDTFLYEFRPYSGMEKLEERKITEKDTFIINDVEIQRKKDKTYEKIENDGFGNITIEGYIYDFDTETLNLEDIMDKRGLKEYVKENGGIRVYRDDMRIYNYGELANDWLGLDLARINSPSSKIGNNLILSAITLNREESCGLEEKTNREGFIENEVFYNFRDSVIFLLNKVNFLRNIDKDKIKNIYKKEIDREESTISIIKKVEKKITNEKVVPKIEDRKTILNNLKKIESNYSEMRDTLLKSAGSGLAYSLVVHEVEKMVAELKSRVEKTNIIELKDLTSKLQSTIEGITNLFTNVKMQECLTSSVIDKSMKFFKYRVKTHNIELVKKFSSSTAIINCSENYIINALMNLVDNSIYWFKYHERRLALDNKKRKVLIDIIETDDHVNIIVADTGYGFSISGETAVLPFKTTKPSGEGMGLGLFFVNEIMKMHNGNLRIVTNEKEKQDLGIGIEYSGAIVILEFNKEDKI